MINRWSIRRSQVISSRFKNGDDDIRKVSSGGAVNALGVAIILWLVSWGWMEVESRKEASALLARDQLKHDLPITVSLMSAVSEFSELSDELDHKLLRELPGTSNT